MDAGQERLEKEFEKLSKELRKEYAQATKEVEAKLNTYLKKFAKKDEIKRAAVRSGAMSQAEYEQWRVGQVAIGERWEEMRDVLAKDLTNTDRIARELINGKMPDAYAIGHNYATFTVEKGSLVDTSYTLYNRNAVQKLLQDNPKLLPNPRLDIPKDLRWNRQHIQSAVTQGLLQGDRIPNIAKRLRNVTNMDYKASVRNARTAMTSAHNKGRLDSLFRAQSMGIEVAKEWVAYIDNVTRDSHVDVNGEVVPLEKTFSNGLDAPGGMGPPEEVYNCRCTMVAAFPKTGKSGTDAEKVNESYDEWEDRLTLADTVVNGKDISDTWARRPDLYKFEIEDVINAQGFDGLPKVVSAEEFEAAVKESKFIAQRTYSAESKEILDRYRNELYHGKWYVDCSTGGAEFGQGMYCAADYTGTLTEGIKKEMRHYHDIGNQRFGGGEAIEAKHYTETFTLDRSAKIIKYSDLFDKKLEWEEGLKNKYVNDALDGWLNEHGLSDNSAAKTFLNFNTQTGNVSWGEATKAHDVLEKEGNLGAFDSYLADAKKAKGDAIAKGVDELNEKKINDIGSFATALGYDAINAEGHGLSGSYTVILNRTKVIFKQP